MIEYLYCSKLSFIVLSQLSHFLSNDMVARTEKKTAKAVFNEKISSENPMFTFRIAMEMSENKPN